ncbi:hypothetical protein EIP91_000552 [Steccherinum ochraceum]|uniref:SnoaL-like domain-containing protein n=1 Tax=Steccherinum ochraceum TaxID=92696 RepID=A0A4R0RP51_9APHY|nr:hypothetical protein EIP91_000552 [Steccherinum ochraceum]
MARFFANTVKSVHSPPTVVVFGTQEQYGWCQQLSEEGYNVYQIQYPGHDVAKELGDVQKKLSSDWALVTYGLQSGDLAPLSTTVPHNLKACIHFCPAVENAEELLFRYSDNHHVPLLVHLSHKQEALHGALTLASDPATYGYTLSTSSYEPIVVHSYPAVQPVPPFPFLMKPPALVSAGEKSTADPYVRSATGLSYTRTLELLRRHLGPHYNLEKLWEMHTYYEFAERSSSKTMATMVAVPYVNHVATMTGGVGFEELSRFYKYHFVRENVTPPDTELITVSRTVGADRIIDEMIFKCTHTTEIDYFIPGVKPTGKKLEIAVVGVVAFRGDKLTFEHLYWDQASALVQLGLLEAKGLPIAGLETARKVIDPFGLPSNTLMEKWKESEGLSID